MDLMFWNNSDKNDHNASGLTVTDAFPELHLNKTVTAILTDDGYNSTKIDNFYFYQTEEVVFLSILLACIVVGNSAVLLALGLSGRRHSRMHFFIMHLAVADLLVGFVTVLGDLIWKVVIKWYAGDAMCKIVKFAQAFVTFASTYMLVALSIDRYNAIARPLSFTTTWTRCKVLVGLAWSISALFASPMLFLSGVDEGAEECWLAFPEYYHWLIYFVLVMSAVLIVPALIICACYTLIIVIIWKNGHLLSSATPRQIYTAERKYLVRASNHTNERSMSDSKESPKLIRVHSGNIGRSSRGVIPQAKIRTVKMTFTIVTAFIICWSPYFIFNLLNLLGYVPHTQNMVAVSTFIQSLAPLNSAANPVIYGIFSTRVCRYLGQLKVFRLIPNILCCQKGDTSRSSGMSECSNYTETGGEFRRSPRNFVQRSPRVSSCYDNQRTSITVTDYIRKTSTYNDMNGFDHLTNRPGGLSDRNSCNVEMCDFIVTQTNTDKNPV